MAKTNSMTAAMSAAVDNAQNDAQVTNLFDAFVAGADFDADARAEAVISAGKGIKCDAIVNRCTFRTNDEGTEFISLVCNKRAFPTMSDDEIVSTNTCWIFRSQIIAAICRADAMLGALIDSRNDQHLSLALSGAKVTLLAEYIAAGEKSMFTDSEHTFDREFIRHHILDVELNQSIVKMLTEKLIAKL